MTQYNPTPMREPFLIDKKEMVELVEEIFITVDQAWLDTQAYEISRLIENYIAKTVK